jgi:NAD(P)H-hydrate epimerase
MQILTAAEMGAADRRTEEEFGVRQAALMENAGTAVARFCMRQYPAAKRVVVLCGKGNNGGDGLVAARVLVEAGVGVEVVLLGRKDELKGLPAEALGRVPAEVAVSEVTDEGGLTDASGAIEAADLIVDAVVGTGFKPPLRGMAAPLGDVVAKVGAVVVAVDLPSGWDADSMQQKTDGAYRADAVVTFTRPKIAHVFGHLTGARKAGGTFAPVVVVEIGSPDEVIQSAGRLCWAGTAKTIAERPRDVNSNKGTFGHVLVVGGSSGMTGAPKMASLAAMRAGAGLVTAAVPGWLANVVGGVAPELMVRLLHQNVEGSASKKNLDGLEDLLKGIKVIAIGPGLSTKGEASEFARGFVAKTNLPIVIDADALNAFADKADLLDGSGRVMVLTPHPGEMARLAGMTIAEVEADRVGLARSFATGHKLTLVLKGWRTLVAHPDGRVAVNTSGNPAMAKGGSGDILTGIVAAMLAQYAWSSDAQDVEQAVEAAVYLHGLAGDLAAQAIDEHTVLATDTVTHLSDAFRYRVKDADGMTWICGVHG